MGVLRRRGAALLAVGALLLAAMPSSGAVAEPPAPGTYLGNGFDACSAPSSSTMDAWLASPYRAVGVYVGGVNRACAQPELTATWVAHQEASGWHLLPIYLGLQASCTTSEQEVPHRPGAGGRPGSVRGDLRGRRGHRPRPAAGQHAVLRHGGLPDRERGLHHGGAGLPGSLDLPAARPRVPLGRLLQPRLGSRRPGGGLPLDRAPAPGLSLVRQV